jgi:hypothetical protein
MWNLWNVIQIGAEYIAILQTPTMFKGGEEIVSKAEVKQNTTKQTGSHMVWMAEHFPVPDKYSRFS